MSNEIALIFSEYYSPYSRATEKFLTYDFAFNLNTLIVQFVEGALFITVSYLIFIFAQIDSQTQFFIHVI